MGSMTNLDAQKASMASDFDIIDDTSAHTGTWIAFQSYSATFGSNTTDVTVDGAGKDLSGLNSVLPDGDMTYGLFTKITLTAGMVKAYKA
ncbi:MAG: hypothetical protein DRQ46_00510 [Gammaproteobacteria bacterium]|nr:MAG: hypothetical protein DRQ46_00510 [Gammaproteobacteria bacterium]